MSQITKDTLIPVTLVIVLLGFAVSVGIVYQKVEETREDVSELKVTISKLDDKMDAMAERQKAYAQNP